MHRQILRLNTEKITTSVSAFFSLLVLLTYTANSQAQIAPSIVWQKSLGGSNVDESYSIEQTTDGGLIVAGYSWSNDGDVSGNHGSADCWIVKLDSSGNIQWQKSLGGAANEWALSIQQTTDGGFIVGANSYSNNGDVTGHHGSALYSDYWIVKLDSSGDIQWQKSLGGSVDEYLSTIQQASDGGFIVMGNSYSNDGNVSGHHGNTSDSDYWVVKLDSSGNIQWQNSLGGSVKDELHNGKQTTDGGFILIGYSYSNDGDVSGNYGSIDYWIVKLDSAGNLQWQNSLGGSEAEDAYYANETSDGGFIVAGYSSSDDGDVSGNHGSYDYWIVKLDSMGNKQWQKSLGGSDLDFANYISQTSDGGFIVGGNVYSKDGDVSGNYGDQDDWVVKLDSAGNILWENSLGGSSYEEAKNVRKTKDGGFLVAADSYSSNGDVSENHGKSDYWVIRLNPSGGIQWQKSLGGSDDEVVYSIEQTTGDNFIVAGNSYSNDGDVSGNHGSLDFWILKITECPDSALVFADFDGDGYGNPADSLTVYDCKAPYGYVFDSTDCDDTNEAINPSASEICNNIDDNCNGPIDDGIIFTTYYADADGDTYGDKNNSISYCDTVSGYVPDSTDCDDTNAAIHPSASEICNNIDDNCNGPIDDGIIFNTYYADADGDTYGDKNNSISYCDTVSGYVSDSTDCDDTNAAINPSASEICNNLDDNCNGPIDEGLIFNIYYADADGDTYGDPGNSISYCDSVNGYVTDSTDCDDTNADVNPDAVEIPNNGIDDDCDGYVDEFGVGVSSIEIHASVLSVFPNPSNGAFVISLRLDSEVNSEATVEVGNQLGQLILKKTTEVIEGNLQQEIQLENLTGGIYMVRVIVKERVYSAQIIYQD